MCLDTPSRHQKVEVNKVLLDGNQPCSDYRFLNPTWLSSFFTLGRANTLPAHLSKAWYLYIFEPNRVLQNPTSSLDPHPQGQTWEESMSLHHHTVVKQSRVDLVANSVPLPKESELRFSKAELALGGSFRALSQKESLKAGCSGQVCLGVGTETVLELELGEEDHLLLAAINAEMEE